MASIPRIAIIGMGGLGCPVAAILAQAGAHLLLLDDDEVELSNLHRQILFNDADIGRPKLAAARDALLARGASANRIECVSSRFLPENALDIASSVDLLIEGADNFATKFLTADAGFLTSTPVVHGSAIRWQATVWAVSAQGKPCYRCLFEDIPDGAQQNCDSAGVIGPVVGFAGALMADLALRLMAGASDAVGQLWAYSGSHDQLRQVEITPRESCPLCGSSPQIKDVSEARYLDPAAACLTGEAFI